MMEIKTISIKWALSQARVKKITHWGFVADFFTWIFLNFVLVNRYVRMSVTIQIFNRLDGYGERLHNVNILVSGFASMLLTLNLDQ